MKRERDSSLSHMVGKFEETATTRYFLDLGISRFTHGERAFTGVRERVTDRGRQ
jgi:hypothetical protein